MSTPDSSSPEPSSHRGWPWVALLLFLPPLILTTIGKTVEPAVITSLQRDRAELFEGDLWRLVTPVLVQSHPLLACLIIFPSLLAIFVVVERNLGPRMLLATALAPVLPAELWGHWVWNLAAGTSVMFWGPLSAMAVVWWARGKRRYPLVGCVLMLLLWTLRFDQGRFMPDHHAFSIAIGLLIGWFYVRRTPH